MALDTRARPLPFAAMALVVACAIPLSSVAAPADSTQHAIVAQPRFLNLKASQGSLQGSPQQWRSEALCCTDGSAASRKRGEALCYHAEERADWLVENKGLSQDEARLQVMSEFPDMFAAPEQPQNTTQTQPRAAPPPPYSMPVIGVGLPKSGSTRCALPKSRVSMPPLDHRSSRSFSVFDYFKCGGVKASHWECSSGSVPVDFCGSCDNPANRTCADRSVSVCA